MTISTIAILLTALTVVLKDEHKDGPSQPIKFPFFKKKDDDDE